MPIWKIASVTDEPEVSLDSWRILETKEGTRHFVGEDRRDRTGRVSSAIVAFDLQTLRGQTLSGRVYQLSGKTAASDNADYVWKAWCKVNEVQSYSDVTKELLVVAADDENL